MCSLHPYNILGRRERASAFVRLSPSKGGVDRITKGRIAEWLKQALHCIPPKEMWTCSFIRLGGDENDWSFHPTSLQFVLQVGTRHPRHRNIEDQTLGLAHAIGREKLFGRLKRLGGEAELPQQVG